MNIKSADMDKYTFDVYYGQLIKSVDTITISAPNKRGAENSVMAIARYKITLVENKEE